MQKLKNLKKCKECKKEFEPLKYATSKTKCQDCIKTFDKEKAFQRLKNRFQKPLKERKPIKVKIDKTQEEVNAKVRERDAKQPCISCGKMNVKLEAGHFISKNKCEELRYDMRNIHGQCLPCNRFLNGNVEQFKLGLIQRYGKEYVDILEAIFQKEREIIVKKL